MQITYPQCQWSQRAMMASNAAEEDAVDLWGRVEQRQFQYAVTGVDGSKAMTLTAVQDRDACEGTPAYPSHGHCVWDAALLLADYLQAVNSKPHSFHGARAVELGAGVGLVGMALAALGAQVVLTDQAYTLPLLRRNVQVNFSGRARAPAVEPCQWGESFEGETLRAWAEQGDVDVVVFSDVLYHADASLLLVQTLRELASTRTRVLFSFETRSAEIEARFLEALHADFDVQQVPRDGEFAALFAKFEYPDELFVFHAQRKPQGSTD